jgi:hypothetical protein
MGQMILFNKRVEEPSEYIWKPNRGGLKIMSLGWGTDGCGLHIGDKVLVIRDPPADSTNWDFKFKGKVGVIQELSFDLKEDYPSNPIVRVCFENIPEDILLDEDGDFKKFEFFKSELLVIR